MPGTVDITAITPSEPRSKRRPIRLYAGLYLAAFAIFLVNIGERTYWRDEIWQLRLADESVGDLIEGLLTETFNGAVSILVTAVLLPIFGTGEAIMRVPSALAMAGVAPLVYAIGRRFHPFVGLGAAVLAVTSPIAFRYAQEVRPYAFAALFAALSLLLLLRASERDGAREWWSLTAGYLLLAYSHIYGLLLIAAHGVWLLSLRRRLPIRHLVLPLAIGLLPLPIVQVVHDTEPYDWHTKPDLRVLGRTVKELFGGRSLAVLFGLALLIVLAQLGGRIWKRGALRRDDDESMLLALLLLSVGVPIVGAFVVSQVKPIFLDRYLIVTLPALFVLVVHGFARFRRPALAGLVALAAVLGLARFPDLPNFQGYEDARSAARVVARTDQPGDLIVYAGGASLGFEHYAGRIGWSRYEADPLLASRQWYGSEEAIARAQDRLRRALADIEPGRVWLVGYDEDSGGRAWFEALESVIRDERRQERRWAFSEVRLALYE